MATPSSSIAQGTKLGSYQVVAAIGAGGMGEVYRARDSKLNRDVALKVLPAAVAQDPERLARFRREAQVLAALNHPNIAHIHGLEVSGGTLALVMELVEGPTLAERIARGPIPLSEALPIMKQVAEALEYAHDKGIVHRDLKPANIKVTPEGTVKVLDFGLAKAMESADGSAADLDNSPTLSLATTRAGIILGTAAYMSPEQAAGRPADRRADVWAFGVVLWEMLTGKKLFEDETVSHTLASVLKDAINLDVPNVPAPIRELLARCLDRNAKTRLQAIGEARIAITRYLANPDAGAPAAAPAQPVAKQTPRLWIGVAAVLALVSIALGIAYWSATRPVQRPMVRLSAELGGDAVLARTRLNGMLDLSPDGTRLVVTFRGKDGKVRLGTRLLNQDQVTPLSGTEDAMTPFFSPDNQWIGFFADGKLKKIAVEGGAAVTICESVAPRGASWGDDGNIVFVPGPGSPLVRVSSDGGTPAPLTKLKEGERTHRWPQVLPGSQVILFTAATAGGTYDDASVEILVVKTGERKLLRRGGFSPRYLASGHVVYLHESTLFAAPFDLKHLALTGAPVPILEDAASNNTAGGDFAFSQNGLFVYVAGAASSAAWPIYWLDNTGKSQVLHSPGRYVTPRLSPDGKRLAYAMGSGPNDDIWVKDLDRNTPSRLTFLSGMNRFPVWTPDGRAIVFQSTDPTKPGLYWIRADGSGEPIRLTEGKELDTPTSFSPDGKRLAFHRIPANRLWDIYTVPFEGDPAHPKLGQAQAFLATPNSEGHPAFSPDGRWLAYQATDSGTVEVYVRPFPGPGGRWQISTGGGRYPRWSRDGKDLMFERGDGALMAAGYTAKGDTFTPAVPRVWSATRLLDFGTLYNYDVAPDSKRVVAFLPGGEGDNSKPLTHLTFLLNFFDELRRRAPGGK